MPITILAYSSYPNIRTLHHDKKDEMSRRHAIFTRPRRLSLSTVARSAVEDVNEQEENPNYTMSSVEKKTAIVTGGANGIGFHYCRELLRSGAKTVAILDLPNSKGEASASELNKEFGAGRALFFPSDVTKFDQFEVVFKSVVEALGGLDILINNAGIFNDFTWQKEIQVNFMAVVKSTLLGYDYMGKHKGGKGGIIANVSSVLGLAVHKHLPVYTATKHAVLSFTVSLKEHFESTGVSVRVMCPGGTDTRLVTDVGNKYLDIVDRAEAEQGQLSVNLQPCEYVGKAMVELIEKGANGAIWISQFRETPFEVELPKYDCIKQ